MPGAKFLTQLPGVAKIFGARLAMRAVLVLDKNLVHVRIIFNDFRVRTPKQIDNLNRRISLRAEKRASQREVPDPVRMYDKYAAKCSHVLP